MFVCPACGTQTNTLIVGSLGVGCRNCTSKVKRDSVNMHNGGGCKGEAKNLTMLDKQHFFNRGIGADGKTCVCKDNPSKRWTF